VAVLHSISALVILVLVSCASRVGPAGPTVEFLSSEETRSLSLPFSEAVRAGPFLFVSGQIGNLPGTFELPAGGIKPQARQALENIQSILVRNGSSMAGVVKCTVFLIDMAEWSDFNEVYVEYFPADPPARSALGASGLAVGARVEVECIAIAPEPSCE
jgi:reactive intermediate/imine deaminase